MIETCNDPTCSRTHDGSNQHAESFLPPCFELGATWYSDDGGLTWQRGSMRATVVGAASLTVTAINHDRGEVTMSVSK